MDIYDNKCMKIWWRYYFQIHGRVLKYEKMGISNLIWRTANYGSECHGMPWLCWKCWLKLKQSTQLGGRPTTKRFGHCKVQRCQMVGMAGKNVVIAGGYWPIFDGYAINILFGPQYIYIFVCMYMYMYIILYPKWKAHYVPIHQFIVNHYSIIHKLCNYIAYSAPITSPQIFHDVAIHHYQLQSSLWITMNHHESPLTHTP